MELVAWDDCSPFECSRRQFENGATPKTARQTPRGYTAPYFSDNIPAIQEDEIDGKPHTEGMHSLAGHYPQALAFSQGMPTKQAASAGRSTIRHFHASQDRVRP